MASGDIYCTATGDGFGIITNLSWACFFSELKTMLSGHNELK